MEFFITIENGFKAMKKRFTANACQAFLDCPYDQLFLYHFGFGTWIRNQLLKEDSDLYRLFGLAGIKNRDEMSKVLIRFFYLYLHYSL